MFKSQVATVTNSNLGNVLIKPLPGNFTKALLGNLLYGPELELLPNLTWEVFD